MEGLPLFSEEDYDINVAPLVDEIVELCKSVEPNFPLAICSTFASEESDTGEVSCCTALVQAHASQRMRYIASVCQNRGKPPMALMAQMHLGKVTEKEMDKDWYKSTPKHKTVGMKIFKLVRQFEKIVNETYIFPTALVLQCNTPGKYLVAGKWPSQNYDGIQFMRVIAQHGFTEEAVRQITGNDPGLGKFIMDMRKNAAIADALLSNNTKGKKMLKEIHERGTGPTDPRKKKKKRKKALDMDKKEEK